MKELATGRLSVWGSGIDELTRVTALSASEGPSLFCVSSPMPVDAEKVKPSVFC